MPKISPRIMLYAGDDGYVDSVAFNPETVLSSEWDSFVLKIHEMIEKHWGVCKVQYAPFKKEGA